MIWGQATPDRLAFGFGAFSVLAATAVRREAFGDGPTLALGMLFAAACAVVALYFVARGGWRVLPGLAGGALATAVLVYVLRYPFVD